MDQSSTPAISAADMTPEDLKKVFQQLSAVAAIETLHEYIDEVRASPDPEVKRKALIFFRENAALAAVQPKEDKPDYPVFHFNIGSGANNSITVTAESGGNVRSLEFTPTEVMAASTYINADIAFDD